MFKSGHTLYHSGDRNISVGGIGFLINKKYVKKVQSTTVVYVVLSSNKMKLIQVYAPTVNHEDEEVRKDEEIASFYEDIETGLTENLR